ncbi:MAG: sigma-70 family RNA polymerase sigma factor [Oscillospiraceae bacterium]|jgi:RNA polymerase sigma-70 factor (ECF subfamily)|nr:sigma-70 family RNA polymerase sigma factor [Oscillospiraceae bacterium]
MTRGKVKALDANAVAQRAWALRMNLTRVALSMLHHSQDAEDAVSAAMLKAYQSAGTLKNEDKLNAWLMRILVATCYDVLRRRKRETPTDDSAAFDMPVLLGAEGSIWEAIQTLPPPYPKILVLFYYEGFKAREIAQILGMPLGTVLVQLSRGRSRLKAILLQEEGVTHCET